MSDKFDEVMSEILKPMSELTMGPIDTMYLMRHDGSLVYTEGYWHPEGSIIGKLIYYPDPDGPKDIHGRRYSSIVKEEKDGEEIYISHEDQLKKVYQLFPDLPPDSHKLILAEYQMAFPWDSFAGYFDDRASLRYVMKHFPRIDEVVRMTSDLFEVPLERLGITGSSALGRKGADIDLVFLGTPEENMDTVQKLWSIVYSQPDKQVVEYGKFWPLKIYVDREEVCTFYVYRNLEDAPIRDCTVELVKEPVEVYGTVAENINSLFVPVVLMLENVYIDGEKTDDIQLVIYDGAVRGEFKRGLRLHIKGKMVNLVKNGIKTPSIAVVDGFNIELERFRAGVPHLQSQLEIEKNG
jgi:predicted nucleotidyltransferase